MPIILKTGNFGKKAQPWWLKIVWICSVCSCEFRLTESDRPIVRQERTPDGLKKVEHPCPHCGTLVQGVYKGDPRGLFE